MRFLDVVLPTIAENLALDEALLLDAEAGGPEVLRIWQWDRHAVVLGAGGRLADDVHEEACLAAGVPILRRSSGGGTVLLGPGCLLYSLVLRFDRHPALPDLRASYRYILERTISALQPFAPMLAMQGCSDLALGDRKVSGNAQQRKRTHLLHHGTLLLVFDPAPAETLLKLPSRQPEYRRRRGHAHFLTNLPVSIGCAIAALRATWDANERCTDWPRERVARLVHDKYECHTWVHRR